MATEEELQSEYTGICERVENGDLSLEEGRDFLQQLNARAETEGIPWVGDGDALEALAGDEDDDEDSESSEEDYESSEEPLRWKGQLAGFTVAYSEESSESYTFVNNPGKFDNTDLNECDDAVIISIAIALSLNLEALRAEYDLAVADHAARGLGVPESFAKCITSDIADALRDKASE